MLSRPHRRERGGLGHQVAQRPLGVGRAEQALGGSVGQHGRTRVAGHDPAVDVGLDPARDHAVILVGVVEQRDHHVVGRGGFDQPQQRRLRAVGVPQRKRRVVVVAGIDLVDGSVNPGVAPVGVVEHRGHEQRAVQVVVEGLLLGRGAAGDDHVREPPVPGRPGGAPDGGERSAGRDLGRQVGRGARRADVADPHPHDHRPVLGGVEGQVGADRVARGGRAPGCDRAPRPRARGGERPIEDGVEVQPVADVGGDPSLKLTVPHHRDRSRVGAVDALADLGQQVGLGGAGEGEAHHGRAERPGDLDAGPGPRQPDRVVARLRRLGGV